MRALFFGTYDAEAHPRVGVLMDGLRSHGVEVVECNVPLGLSTSARVSMLKRPWLLPRLLARLAYCWLALALRAIRLPSVDVVVVGYLGHFDVRLARQLFRRTPIVLDHLISASDTAADRGLVRGLRPRLLGGLDSGALQAADLVLVDTDEHREALPADQRHKTAVITVGAPLDWLRAGASVTEPLPTSPLRVIFFGLYTPLQGAPVIGRALAMLREGDIEVSMVGSGQDLAETQRLASANPRVTWRAWVPPADLPRLVSGHHVCLGIFGTGPKARRVVPNKVFQGAAAGCALVTSDTAPQRRLLGDAAVLTAPGDADALAAVLRSLAADPGEVQRLRSAARELAAARFTPAAVTSPLHNRLTDLVPPGSTALRSRT